MFQPNQDEDAVEFANRVKRKIAMAGGLVDLVWDGNLKRQVLQWNFHSAQLLCYDPQFQAVKSEWRESQQEQFSRRLKVE